MFDIMPAERQIEFVEEILMNSDSSMWGKRLLKKLWNMQIIDGRLMRKM